MKCPHCNENIYVRFVKAPSDSGGQSSGRTSDVGALLEQIHDDELETQFEIDFIKQTRERFEQYGDRIRMSDKQMACLQRIAAGNPR